MGEIESYLESEAERDVAALLASPCEDAEPMWGLGLLWERFPAEAWTRLVLSMRDQRPVSVYFRPEGDRYVVTDLGEAARALRLRTGIYEERLTWADFATPLNTADFFPPGVNMRADGYLQHVSVRAPDLPRALCAVMLAAHRVANLSL